MVVYKTYQHNGVDAFSILLKQNLVKGNKIYTTLPNDFLNFHFKRLLIKIRNAYLPNNEIAIHCMDGLANQILLKSQNESLYYPTYLRFGKHVNESIIFKLISLQCHLHVWPNTHYCMYNRELDFYVMKAMYIVERNTNNPQMVDVSLAEFRDFLSTEEMKLDYDRLEFPGNKVYRIIENRELRYLLLVNKDEELLMVLSL